MNTTKTTKTPIIKSPKIKSREYSLHCKIYSNFQGWSTSLCAKRMTIDTELDAHLHTKQAGVQSERKYPIG